MVVVAFATVYIVWGSTYLFIQFAVRDFPPFIFGAIRFLAAGGLMLVWCLLTGESKLSWSQLRSAVIVGLLLLLIGNGAVMTAEQWLPSSLVAVLISTTPFWFVILDFPEWKNNLRNIPVIAGLILGFAGVTLMFGEKVVTAIFAPGLGHEMIGLLILLAGTISWAGGSLYSKARSSGSAILNAAWQMFAAGIVFFIGSFISGEWHHFDVESVRIVSWLSLGYLVFFGSIAAFSAYVWLLRVRSAASVSTYGYVNPVIAVLLGVLFAGERLSLLQTAGVIVILVSVLLINLRKYRKP
jgi:drug/metabolite transporter (DMT)-like permease